MLRYRSSKKVQYLAVKAFQLFGNLAVSLGVFSNRKSGTHVNASPDDNRQPDTSDYWVMAATILLPLSVDESSRDESIHSIIKDTRQTNLISKLDAITFLYGLAADVTARPRVERCGRHERRDVITLLLSLDTILFIGLREGNITSTQLERGAGSTGM